MNKQRAIYTYQGHLISLYKKRKEMKLFLLVVYVYVADCSNHRVMRWLRGATEGSVAVGGNGSERKTNQFINSWVLSFDRENSLYVIDKSNN